MLAIVSLELVCSLAFTPLLPSFLLHNCNTEYFLINISGASTRPIEESSQLILSSGASGNAGSIITEVEKSKLNDSEYQGAFIAEGETADVEVDEKNDDGEILSFSTLCYLI